MKVYLMRHGEADEKRMPEGRHLSERGKADMNRLAAHLAPLKIELDYVFHSEKLRARETAAILSGSFLVKEPLELRSYLSPESEITQMVEEIYALDCDVLLVGHMPFMGKLLSQLVVRDEATPVAAFRTGTLVCLEQVERERWAVSWMLTPDLF